MFPGYQSIVENLEILEALVQAARRIRKISLRRDIIEEVIQDCPDIVMYIRTAMNDSPLYRLTQTQVEAYHGHHFEYGFAPVSWWMFFRCLNTGKYSKVQAIIEWRGILRVLPFHTHITAYRLIQRDLPLRISRDLLNDILTGTGHEPIRVSDR